MIVFFHFIFSYTKYLWQIYFHRQVCQELQVLFETSSKTEAFEKYENRRLNLESLGISPNSNEHNLKCKSSEDGIFFRSTDFKLDFEPAFFVNGNIRFNPPVFQQRYLTIAHIISNEKWEGKIRKVVEFGCSEIGLLNYLKLIQGISEINLVDIDGQVLKDNVHRIQPWFCESYNFQRAVPLTVNVLQGSVSHPDRYCKGVDAVIAIELIEHMYEDELSQLPLNIFGYIRPRVAIFTTPNSDFNVLFINFSGFRHHDHKFEWSRNEFETWAKDICVQYPQYEVSFIGIGPPPLGREDLGYCSQGAVFMRLQNDTDNLSDCEELNATPYKLIETAEFPVVEQISPDIKTLTDAGHFIRVSDRFGDFQRDHKTVIPLSSILIRVYQTCKSTQKLRQILEKKYKIEENSDGEEVLIYSGESDCDSDSGLDENYLTNGVQESQDVTEDNHQWEQQSDHNWGSVKEDVVDVNVDQQWGQQTSCVLWDCEETETVNKSVALSSANSASDDASCGNLDELKEILTNLPLLQLHSETDYVFDPSQQSDVNVILDDSRSVGLETIVSVSDENYESSNVSSNCQIRTSDSSVVMDLDERKSLMSCAVFNEPSYLSENNEHQFAYSAGDELTKTKSLQSIGEKHVSKECGDELTSTKSLQSVSGKLGDELKSWKSLQSVSEKQSNPGEFQSNDSRSDFIDEVKIAKTVLSVGSEYNLSKKCEEDRRRSKCFYEDINNKKSLHSFEHNVPPDERQEEGGASDIFDEVKKIEDLQSNNSELTDTSEKLHIDDKCFGEELKNTSGNIQNAYQCPLVESDFGQNSNTEISKSITHIKEKYQTSDEFEQGGAKFVEDPIPVTVHSLQESYCEKNNACDFDEEQLSDFDSISSLNPHAQQWSDGVDRTVLSLDTELETEDDISGNNYKLPISVQDLSCLSENVGVEIACNMGTCKLGCYNDEKQQFQSEVSCDDQQYEEMGAKSLNKLENTYSSDRLVSCDEKHEQSLLELNSDSFSSNATYICANEMDGALSVSKALSTHEGCYKETDVSDIGFDGTSTRSSKSKETVILSEIGFDGTSARPSKYKESDNISDIGFDGTSTRSSKSKESDNISDIEFDGTSARLSKSKESDISDIGFDVTSTRSSKSEETVILSDIGFDGTSARSSKSKETVNLDDIEFDDTSARPSKFKESDNISDIVCDGTSTRSSKSKETVILSDIGFDGTSARLSKSKESDISDIGFDVTSAKPSKSKESDISDIGFEGTSARPSQSKDSELSYKSCDTSIKEDEDTFRSNLVGNACLPDLIGLNLSLTSNNQSSSSTSVGSKTNADESRRFSSTSFIYKSQSQEKIKEIYSFRSITFDSDGKDRTVGATDVKDSDSPLHKCYSTGKIGKDFSVYNDGVISNSCVDKFPSCLASELEFFDKNNDLARERRCMSVSCIGNINVEYDENSCLDMSSAMEERELQNSCSPDKFGPDSGYPNSSSGLDMEMDTPEQVKEIMTESESSFDESPLESPVHEDLPIENLAVVHPPVIPVGENVENGDVANNNRDGEGNNMVGPGIVGDALEFHALIEENEGNLQLMEAACNVEGLLHCVDERSKDVDESTTSTGHVVDYEVERHSDENQETGIEEQPCASSSSPEQNPQLPFDLPSNNSHQPSETNNNCDQSVPEEMNIGLVDDLRSLVPLSLVEIVLNNLIREMAEDVLMQIEIGNALFFAANERIPIIDVEAAAVEQDPTDFMGGGDSAAENM